MKTPRCIVELTRGKITRNISSKVISCSYIESEEQADYATVTVDASDFSLLSSELIINDTVSRMKVSFGYSNGDMFPTVDLYLVQSEPSFGKDGIKLRLEAMDKGTFLTGVAITKVWKHVDVVDVLPAARKKDKKIKASDIVKKLALLRNLEADVEETEEAKTEWHQSNMSDMEFLEELRRGAVSYIRGTAGGAYRCYISSDKGKEVLHFKGIFYGEESIATFTWGIGSDVLSFTTSVTKEEIKSSAFGVTEFIIGSSIVNGEIVVSKVSGVLMIRDVASKGDYLIGIDKSTKRVGLYDINQNKLPIDDTTIYKMVDYATGMGASYSYNVKSGETLTGAGKIINTDYSALSGNPNFTVWGDAVDNVSSNMLVDEDTPLGGTIAQSLEGGDKAAADKLQEMNDLESKAVKAELLVLGNTKVRAGNLIMVAGVGKVFGGKWYVTEVEHVIDDKGYTSALKLQRSSIGIQDPTAEALPTKEAGNDYKYDAKDATTIVIPSGSEIDESTN